MNNKIIYIVSIILMFAGGVVVGLWFATGDENAATATTRETGKGKGEPLYYRNPMNPAITSPVPAKDEMGMDYIPVYAGGAREQVPGTVSIDPVTVQAIGVRTAEAKKESLSRIVRAPGRIDYDEETMNRLHPKIQGWIEELRVDKTGEAVRKDEILLSIYSQNLVTSQEEYLLALQSLENAERNGSGQAIKSARQIANSARQRLVLLDVPEHQIVELEETRKVKRSLHIHSPFSGIVTKIGAREGQFVTPGTEIFMIGDLSEVWVYV
ncbi:MAG: efflux RND transporter periplasmic adaptor subunit, partial [Pseudomonadales bacterium]|nr:efflux RND transporter periplasmic adaptor subunit [Pseudomonadales bacterium]